MTERKPPGLSFESWIDKQIREATERGEFDNLSGAGKPLRNENQPYHEMWWVREKMERENLTYMPPSMAIRSEVEEAVETARKAPSERVLRQILTEVNEKIDAAMRRPLEGPPLHLAPVDIEAAVREWKQKRQR
ncbi:J-domain-containing protein [Kitasatospora sp. NBC_01266]|uniref:DnaJ family domain-containing protein n=1 Tax=Kitasatospora sp. NBC_01266 TaxID=2903572 RepID=UPI002E328C6D|nr:DUF1992 domain-containing protein [Kitasatospora sp. NBC_01266]